METDTKKGWQDGWCGEPAGTVCPPSVATQNGHLSDMNLYETMDAAIWAKEFVRINGGDEGTMIAWFANAIMTGYDHSRWKITKEIKDILDIQGQDGNWNSSNYMTGLYNGLELSVSVIEGRSPEYRKCIHSDLSNLVINIDPALNLPTLEDVMGCQPMTIGGEEYLYNEAYERAMKVIR